MGYPSQALLLWIAATAAVLLAAWLAWQNRDRIAAWRGYHDDQAGPLIPGTAARNGTAGPLTTVTTATPETAGPLTTATTATPVTAGPPGRLPSLDERTDMLAALRTDCEVCGQDHPGSCERRVTTAGWQLNAGRWTAPPDLWEGLPAGDWLRELLEDAA